VKTHSNGSSRSWANDRAQAVAIASAPASCTEPDRLNLPPGRRYPNQTCLPPSSSAIRPRVWPRCSTNCCARRPTSPSKSRPTLRLVEFAARTQPAVIVTEFTLEGLGGPELVKRLRASSQASSIVGWTGLQDLDKIAEILATGVEASWRRRTDPSRAPCDPDRARWRTFTFEHHRHDGGRRTRPTPAAEPAARAEITEIREQMEQGTAQSRLPGDISHELRTPVTVAKGIAYVLRNPTVPADERDEFLLSCRPRWTS